VATRIQMQAAVSAVNMPAAQHSKWKVKELQQMGHCCMLLI